MKTNNNSIMNSKVAEKTRKSKRKNRGWGEGKSPVLPRIPYTEKVPGSNATRGNDDDKPDIKGKKTASKKRKIVLDLEPVVELEEAEIGSHSVNELSSSRGVPTKQEELDELELDQCNSGRSSITTQAMMHGFGCGNDDDDDDDDYDGVIYGCLPFWAPACGIDFKKQNRTIMSLRQTEYSPPPELQPIDPNVWMVKLIHGFYADEAAEEAALNYDWSIPAVAEALHQLQGDMPPGASFLDTLNQMGKAFLVSDDGEFWCIVGNDGNSFHYGNDEAGSLKKMTQALRDNLLDNKRSNLILHCPMGCCDPYSCDPEHEERYFLGKKPILPNECCFDCFFFLGLEVHGIVFSVKWCSTTIFFSNYTQTNLCRIIFVNFFLYKIIILRYMYNTSFIGDFTSISLLFSIFMLQMFGSIVFAVTTITLLKLVENWQQHIKQR
jgi:hypothetical protein